MEEKDYNYMADLVWICVTGREPKGILAHFPYLRPEKFNALTLDRVLALASVLNDCESK